ncbi:hypothetical protein N9491_06070 [Planktomarina temperata]|nr:hypothetical protein [Planktomarina temperata]
MLNSKTSQDMPQQKWASVILFYSKQNRDRANDDLGFRSGVFAGQIGATILVATLFVLERLISGIF